MNTNLIFNLKEITSKILNQKPLILNLTNLVTMDFMANSLLAIGAAPIMSQEKKEIEELIIISNAININIGTLNKDFIKLATIAFKFAKKYNKKVILDPVGSGASKVRTKYSKKFAKLSKVIRGNASEIISLQNQETFNKSKGVESISKVEDTKNFAKSFSKKYNCCVVVSGPKDYITDGKNEIEYNFGSILMTKVTGMGCVLNSIIATFCSVEEDTFKATSLATAFYGLCGNMVEKKQILLLNLKVNLSMSCINLIGMK